MHLRDYPLPLLHSPRNKDMDETSFKLNGHLVISEAFAKAIEHMRQIDVPLVPEHKHKHKQLNKFEFWLWKNFGECKVVHRFRVCFNSNYPTKLFGVLLTILEFNK